MLGSSPSMTKCGEAGDISRALVVGGDAATRAFVILGPEPVEGDPGIHAGKVATLTGGPERGPSHEKQSD